MNAEMMKGKGKMVQNFCCYSGKLRSKADDCYQSVERPQMCFWGV